MITNGNDVNRTGTALAKDRLAEMIEGTQEFPPTSAGGAADLARELSAEANQSPPLGTMPPPAKLRGLLAGPGTLTLLDKMGERLAFERTGTRLYEALMAKRQGDEPFAGGPSLADLQAIRDDELAHFELLRAAVEELGGDPTAVTPSADVAAVASMGILQVVHDPRASLLQSLEVMLIAELTDSNCWQTLVDLAKALGKDGLAERFAEAQLCEAEHVLRVKGWVQAGLGQQAGQPLAAPPAG